MPHIWGNNSAHLISTAKDDLPFPYPLWTNQRRTCNTFESFEATKKCTALAVRVVLAKSLPGVQELTAITSHLPGKFEFVYAPKVQACPRVFLLVSSPFELRRKDFPGISRVVLFVSFNISSRNPLRLFARMVSGELWFGWRKTHRNSTNLQTTGFFMTPKWWLDF